MSSPADATPPEQGKKQEVDDEENRSQNATIRRIQSFRDDIADYQLLFARNEVSKQLSEREALRSYHQLVKGFLQLLRPYLTDDSISEAQKYWTETTLGTITVDPPASIQRPSQARFKQALTNNDPKSLAISAPQNNPSKKMYRVKGLKDFAEWDAEWQVEWQVMFGPAVTPDDLRERIQDSSVSVLDASHRNEPIRVQKTAQLPRHIIDSAVLELENFVRGVGMDVDFDEEEQQTEIDRDLLEEVDQWRKQNLD